MNKNDLDFFEKVDITKIEKDKLYSINKMDLNPAIEPNKRITDYFSTTENPYCFLCKDEKTSVKIMFDNNSTKTIETLLKEHYKALKNS